MFEEPVMEASIVQIEPPIRPCNADYGLHTGPESYGCRHLADLGLRQWTEVP